MPDISELRAQLRALEAEVVAKLPEIATLISLTAKAFANRNIVDKGFGATYSTNPIPAWFFHGKELNAAGTAFLANHGVGATGKAGEPKKKRRKKGETADTGSYDTDATWAEFRGAQGLQTAHVDLSYSNKMWAGTLPETPRNVGGIIMAPLAGSNKEVQDKLNWNFERFGDFIGKAITPDNFNTLLQVVYDEIIVVIDQSGIILKKS